MKNRFDNSLLLFLMVTCLCVQLPGSSAKQVAPPSAQQVAEQTDSAPVEPAAIRLPSATDGLST